MKVQDLVEIIDADFFTGVPDSQLKPLCNYLMATFGIDRNHHIIAANEGNCVALAAGYHLATGKVPVVYMQNSGEGNIVNPVASLLNKKVYAIPVIFVIGWRGEPGIHDEPQHIFQGEITLSMLDALGISYFIIDHDTKRDEVETIMKIFRTQLENGKNIAFIVRKNALSYDGKVKYSNKNSMLREEIIRYIAEVSNEEPVIATTGKASRELFEIRDSFNQSHKYDFLTVGSMGHSSSIALGIAIHKPQTKIWCIDGDGSLLMHMGAIAVLGANKPENMVHIVINNEAHETVGGMPTVSESVDMVLLAKACGYPYACSVGEPETLKAELAAAKERNCLTFIEIKAAIGARDNLGRPTISPIVNKINFMNYLKQF